MDTYAGLDSFPATANLPAKDEPATPESLGDPIKAALDRTAFLLKRMAGHAEAQHPLEIECTDGINIVISPLLGVVGYDTMPRYIETTAPIAITKSVIEGAVAPTGSTTYYLYAYLNGTPQFQLSLVRPDRWKLWKSTNSAFALIGICQTDATAKFAKMRQTRHQVRYLEPPQVRSPIAASLGADVDLAPRLPPEARGVFLAVNADTSVAAVSAIVPYVAVGPFGVDPTKFRKIPLSSNVVHARNSEPVEVPLPIEVPPNPVDKRVRIQTDAGTTTIELLLHGFWW